MIELCQAPKVVCNTVDSEDRSSFVISLVPLARTFTLFLPALVLCAWTARGWCDETNSPANSSTPPKTRQIRPPELAEGQERAGRKLEAALLYEEMARTNSVARKVLAGRLVTIYARSGETNKALTWAHEVMRDNPDPQAYLAAVYGMLGACKEAGKILQREIDSNTNATRAVTLRWQLAEIAAKQGDKPNAEKLRKEAADAAKGTPLESAARKKVSDAKGTGDQVSRTNLK